MKFNILLLAILTILMIVIPLKNFGKIDMLQQKTPTKPIEVSLPNNTTKQDIPEVPSVYDDEIEVKKDLDIDLEKPFKILDKTTGKIKSVDQKEFVMGALCSEMPVDFHMEALKAQAVSAHTYALYNVAHKNQDLDGADFSADPSKWEGYVTKKQAQERFGDKFEIYWDRIETAVDEAFGKVMIYEEQPILAAYHSMSGGITESADNVWKQGLPYLVPVESRGDLLGEDFETIDTFTSQQVRTIVQENYPDIKLDDNKADKWLKIIAKSDSGYVTEAEIGGNNITGKDMRSLFDLRSSCFDVEYSNGQFKFVVKGYGHGVGLSQYGADYMGRQGHGYKEILEYYYKNSLLISVK